MEYLKIAVLNNSGNVGKSTICQTFLMPRLPNAELIRVETINTDGIESEGISAKDMTNVIQQIDLGNIVVIDVGSSNIENFMMGLKRNTGSHEDIDFFLIPTTPETKQQKDTVSTIDNLLDLGVSPSSLIVLLNKVDESVNIERQFQTLIEADLLKTIGRKSLTELPAIFNSEIFNLLEQIKCTFSDALEDETDYKSAIRETEDKTERAILSIKRTANRLAVSHALKLDAEFAKLSLTA
ncbi:hypothetical protein KFE26_21410 [Shewanella sp. M16]|uniref:StbB family protein n=1 Tax=Shewanella sp. M16 TaxID=2830837 RepID=UPI001BB02A8D|nr:StbB family protein [Shewanella sp. M16]MBS0044828.1 hypothetical protein [Shewanella sp. M16]